jgi:hypothetical protein
LKDGNLLSSSFSSNHLHHRTFTMNTGERIEETRPPKKTGKPINHSMKPRYIGCLIFEYIPVVTKSPS